MNPADRPDVMEIPRQVVRPHQGGGAEDLLFVCFLFWGCKLIGHHVATGAEDLSRVDGDGHRNDCWPVLIERSIELGGDFLSIGSWVVSMATAEALGRTDRRGKVSTSFLFRWCFFFIISRGFHVLDPRKKRFNLVFWLNRVSARDRRFTGFDLVPASTKQTLSCSDCRRRRSLIFRTRSGRVSETNHLTSDVFVALIYDDFPALGDGDR